MSSENSPESTQSGRDALNVDGFKKRKLSEQLKLEREIFPECIQALSTYCNKKRESNKDTHRRSRRNSLYFASKENLLFPEKVVETANKNVERWLDQQKIFNKPSRKPFLDLNVNVEQHRESRSNLRQKRSLSILDNKENTNNVSKEIKIKKRSHFKLTNTTTDNQHSPKNNRHRKSPRYTKDTLQTSIVNNHNKIQDESGIFVDETIVIEDSQSTFVDKDREALLSVMRADENGQNSDSEVALDYSDLLNYTNDINKTLCDSNLSKDNIIHQSSLGNVPFLKKSYLYESCQFCSPIEVDKKKQGELKDKNILVKIETGNFIATINVIHVENIVNNKSSIALQTDISEIYESTVKSHTDETERDGSSTDFTKQPLFSTITVESQDVFSDTENRNIDMVKHVVIYSSESDFEKEDNEKNLKCVLTEISQPNQRRSKIVRRPTPASSDSSEKENFDPNKRKRRRMLDKGFKKIKRMSLC